MAAETAAKRARLSGPPVIGTHNGHFHADEALAVYMLRLLPTYAQSSLVRTRDPDLLKECDIVVDVGGQYDPAANRFDHHQREFNSTFPGRSTKLSSAGLVFLHLGKSIIANQIGLAEDSDDVNQLYEKMYDDFIEAFDANDNGISPYDTTKLLDMGVTKRFNDRGFSIASVVGRYNYSHDLKHAAKQDKPQSEKQKEEDERFLLASAFTGSQFLSELIDSYKSWLPARQVVREHFMARKTHDETGRILILPYRKEGLPWQDHLYHFEDEQGCKGQVLYAIFPESGEPATKYRVRAVSRSPDSFESRKALPEKWRGVRDEALSELTQIPGCIFVHASGFIAGNKTFEGALAMAKTALEID